MRWIAWYRVAFVAVIAFSPLALSQQGAWGRYRVAALDFEVNVVGELVIPEGAVRVMATAFERSLFRSGRFTVVAQSTIDRVLGELGLSQSGLMASDQVLEFGRLAGADVVITGVVTVLSASRWQVTAVFRNVESGIFLDAQSIAVSGVEEFFDAADEFVAGALAEFPLRGNVLEWDGVEAFIDVGRESGVRVGDGGTVVRTRLVGSSSFLIGIGSFVVVDAYDGGSLISVTLDDPGVLLQEGDRVLFDDAGAAGAMLPSLAPQVSSVVRSLAWSVGQCAGAGHVVSRLGVIGSGVGWLWLWL